jgi:hypothetical protein
MILTQGNKNLLINGNQLTFLDNRFYITEGNDYVPSVTTVLDCYPKSFAFLQWLKDAGENADEIRDEAGRRGSIVHKLTEDYDNGLQVTLLDENGFIGYKLGEWKMFEKYVEFRQRFETFIIHNEINVVSVKYGIGGTVDRVMKIDDKIFLIDIKTSNSVSPHFWLQVAAYRKLLEEKNIIVDGVGILWLNAKTKTNGKPGTIQGDGYQLIIREETEKDWQLFQATHKLWIAEYGDQKPKQLSYKLSHKYSK